MLSITVGVDISKKKFDVARLQNGKYRHKVFSNDQEGFALFLAWLATFGPELVLIAMEATGAYSLPLAQFLSDHDFWVSIVNPAKIKAFAGSELSRTKTDKADAKLIARYALEKQPTRWIPPSLAIRELQALVRRVDQLLGMRQMEQNRLDTADSAATPSIQIVIKTIDQEIENIREQIRNRIKNDPDLKQRRDLLISIPGIGEATVAHLLVLFDAHHGFKNAKQAAAFAGLVPNPHQSGQSGKTRLSKVGDALIRKVLYMPSLTAWRHNPLIRKFCERLKETGKNGKAIACAAMRKLIHISFGVLKSGKPFDPNFGLA